MSVVLKDVNAEQAERGKQYSANLLDKLLAQKRVTDHERQAILNRIQTTAQASDLQGCDLVIEAVFENRYCSKNNCETEAQLLPTAVFASNTSTLPISGVLARTNRAPRTIYWLALFFACR